MAKKKVKGLVIVESPAKARKISGYLGKDYNVLASMGHVRDLPNGASEIPKAVKKEPVVDTRRQRRQRIRAALYHPQREEEDRRRAERSALKDADELIIATDEDREGESIGWHLVELLQPKVPVKRMVFSEITKKAISKRLDQTRGDGQEPRLRSGNASGSGPFVRLYAQPAAVEEGRSQTVSRPCSIGRGAGSGGTRNRTIAFHSGTYWDLKGEPRNRNRRANLTRACGRSMANESRHR